MVKKMKDIKNDTTHNTDEELSGAGVQYFMTNATADQLEEIFNNIDAVIARVKSKENNR